MTGVLYFDRGSDHELVGKEDGDAAAWLCALRHVAGLWFW